MLELEYQVILTEDVIFLDLMSVIETIPKCIHLSKSVGKCKKYRPRTKMYWMAPSAIGRHFEHHQLKEISYIISRYFQSIFSYLNRLKTAEGIY
jgi:Fe-S-cluster containining protein